MVYILLGEGYEEIEAVTPCDILRRGGVAVSFAAVGNQKCVAGSHKITICCELLTRDITPQPKDIFVIPGGMGGVNSIQSDTETMNLLRAAAEIGAEFAAICAGPSVLAQLGLLEGKHITCYPGCEELMDGALCDSTKLVASDGSLITGRAPGSAIDFGLALLAHIIGEDAANKIRTELVY
ncbi:MAG: DJ-1/PfpI family protein [Clostridia bacterium]|nr:DJ-1/PfpI family protein [Clostridia bacterium]